MPSSSAGALLCKVLCRFFGYACVGVGGLSRRARSPLQANDMEMGARPPKDRIIIMCPTPTYAVGAMCVSPPTSSY